VAYDPISVALKFGFLAVLYLFLFFIARSAMKDLRRTLSPAPDQTGFHSAPAVGARSGQGVEAWLLLIRGGGLSEGDRFDLIGGLSIGRSKEADVLIEDMGSTNGTLLNDATLNGEAELIDGDAVRIGDTEFRFEAHA
jgi:hypothetical protein